MTIYQPKEFRANRNPELEHTPIACSPLFHAFRQVTHSETESLDHHCGLH